MMIASLDALSILLIFLSLCLIVVKHRKFLHYISSQISLLLLTSISIVYALTMFLEWAGISSHYDHLEDLLGAMIPMLWIFLFYALIQHVNSRSLKVSEERMHLALMATQAGMWDWFVQSGNVIINERWAEIIGYSIADLTPVTYSTWEKYVHPDDLNDAKTQIQRHFDREIDFFSCEIRMLHKNGHWVWVLTKGMLVERDDDGTPVRMTGTHLDITERKNSQIELKQQVDENIALNEEYLVQNEELQQSLTNIQIINQKLEIAKQKAEQSDRLKSAFLANISHEIRTPMNGIIGFSDMLTIPNLSEDKRKYFAGLVSDNSRQLLTIVNDILDISRIETGNVVVAPEKINISQIVTDVVQFWQPQIAQKGLALYFEPELSFDDSWIVSDKTRMIQILNNLLSNALKFTNKGFISVKCGKEGEEFIFSVEDSGIGIAQSSFTEVFEAFRQVEIGTTRQYGGTGLGLAISKRLVELLGGKMWLESTVDQGSCFYFSLPLNHNFDVLS